MIKLNKIETGFKPSQLVSVDKNHEKIKTVLNLAKVFIFYAMGTGPMAKRFQSLFATTFLVLFS